MAHSFDNPDFVDVVIHSYRHRYALVPGDPALEKTEQRLVAQPHICVPTIAFDGDGAMPLGGSPCHEQYFKAAYERRVIANAGHNLPQEAPNDFAAAVMPLAGIA